MRILEWLVSLVGCKIYKIIEFEIRSLENHWWVGFHYSLASYCWNLQGKKLFLFFWNLIKWWLIRKLKSNTSILELLECLKTQPTTILPFLELSITIKVTLVDLFYTYYGQYVVCKTSDRIYKALFHLLLILLELFNQLIVI